MVTDALVVTVTQVIVFGHLFPLIGLPRELAAPIYVGVATNFAFYLGFVNATNISHDIEHGQLINYQLTLPLAKRWIIAKYVLSFIIENSLIITPIIVVATALIGGLQNIQAIFLILYPIMLAFFGLLFFMFGVRYEPRWLRLNVWPRRLIPLMFFSGIVSPWHTVYAFSPVVAYLMLLNPITYAADGMRSSLLATALCLPAWLCTSALILFAIPVLLLLNQSIKRRLDPV